MCLIVQDQPATAHDSYGVPCTKRLYRGSWGYQTPFLSAFIPSDGVLLPKGERYRKSIYLHSGLGPGFIHAYNYTVPESHKHVSIYNITERHTWALNVVAFGTRGDLVTTALYIPSLDKSGKKTKRSEALRRLQYKEKITLNDMKLIFPELPNRVWQKTTKP